MRKSGYITLPHNLLDVLQTETLRVYGLLHILFKMSAVDEVAVSLEQIEYCISGTTNLSRRRKAEISKALDQIGAVRCENGIYILETSKLNAEPPYEECDSEIFMRLISHPELLLHYLVIKSGRMFNFDIGGKNKVICKYPIEYMSNIEGVSRHTIMRYNSALEEMQLIYIARHKFDGDKRETNIYSLYEDRALVDRYVGGLLSKDNSQANKNRSIAMRYTKFIKNPEKYTMEYAMKLRKDVEEYNASMDELSKTQPDFLLRKKDLDVFDLQLTKLISNVIV